MRFAFLPLVIALVAAPAAAQINGSRQASASQRERGAPMPDNSWRGELAMIDRDAREDRAAGRISRQESRSIRRQTGLVRSLGSAYAANGLSEAEIAFLEAQAFALRELVRAPLRPVPARRR